MVDGNRVVVGIQVCNRKKMQQQKNENDEIVNNNNNHNRKQAREYEYEKKTRNRNKRKREIESKSEQRIEYRDYNEYVIFLIENINLKLTTTMMTKAEIAAETIIYKRRLISYLLPYPSIHLYIFLSFHIHTKFNF